MRSTWISSCSRENQISKTRPTLDPGIILRMMSLVFPEKLAVYDDTPSSIRHDDKLDFALLDTTANVCKK